MKKINKNAVAVMLKAPQIGLVKTRLAMDLGKEKTLSLYIAFLKDYFSRIISLNDVDVYAFITPTFETLNVDCKNILNDIIPRNFKIKNQVEGDLGVKIQNVFHTLFDKDYSNVAVTGSDSPDLPLDFFSQSFKLLSNISTSVFVPAKDGGYCLVAMNSMETCLFENISWSSENVMEETLNILNANNMSYKLLETWYDVDNLDDLKSLDLVNLPNTANLLKDIV